MRENETTKEFEYRLGYETALDDIDRGRDTAPQDDMTADIPLGDYVEMQKFGHHPETARKYWKGYNAAIFENLGECDCE